MKQANVIETKKSGDSVVYQVPGAFALLFVVLVALRRIGAYYGTVDGFQPVLYVVCALWLVCLLLCYVLGASFAYYCMFAAIAFELVAAVYYTFQLK